MLLKDVKLNWCNIGIVVDNFAFSNLCICAVILNSCPPLQFIGLVVFHLTAI